jgi:hypothetical protein
MEDDGPGLGWVMGTESLLDLPDAVPILDDLADHGDQRRVEKDRAAIAGEEADVRHHNGVGARPDLRTPPTGDEQISRPPQGLLDLALLEPFRGLDVHHRHQPVDVGEQEVGDVAPTVVLDQEGLRRDADRPRVEVGQDEAGKLEATLVDDVAGGRGRPVGAGVVLLAPVPPKLPPGQSSTELGSVRCG